MNNVVDKLKLIFDKNRVIRVENLILAFVEIEEATNFIESVDINGVLNIEYLKDKIKLIQLREFNFDNEHTYPSKVMEIMKFKLTRNIFDKVVKDYYDYIENKFSEYDQTLIVFQSKYSAFKNLIQKFKGTSINHILIFKEL